MDRLGQVGDRAEVYADGGPALRRLGAGGGAEILHGLSGLREVRFQLRAIRAGRHGLEPLAAQRAGHIAAEKLPKRLEFQDVCAE